MKMNYRDLYFSVVNRIYQNHNPDKISDIPDLFDKYKGREKELIELICRKYNVTNEELKVYVDEYKSVFMSAPKGNFLTKILLISTIVCCAIILVYIFFFESKQEYHRTRRTNYNLVNDDNGITASNDEVEIIKQFWSHVDTHLDFETLHPSITGWLYNISKELSNGDNTDAKGRMADIKNDVVFQDLIFLRLYEKYHNDKERMREVLNAMCSGYEIANPVSDWVFKRYSMDKRVHAFKAENNDEVMQNENENFSEIQQNTQDIKISSVSKFYKVFNKTYFHSSPNNNDRLKSYLIEGEMLEATREENGFVYTEFTNLKGKVTIGWIKKIDLLESINDEQQPVVQPDKQIK